MSNEKIYCWHFHNGETLRDGRPLPAVGETLVHEGPLKLCAAGLHGSISVLDAFTYAPGTWLDLCLVGGEILHGDDKLCAERRTALQRHDVREVLVRFAWACAWRVREYAERAEWDAERAEWAAERAAELPAEWSVRAAKRAALNKWVVERIIQEQLLLAGLKTAGFDLVGLEL